MILGTALVLAALSLFLWNQRENNAAGASAEKILSRITELIEMNNMSDTDAAAENGAESNPGGSDPYDPAMREAEIDGYAYVGYLYIPSLELALPVMSEWDENRLKISPCRYFGSTKTDNLVICGHNYISHFGPIRHLAVGDRVYFTDMDGVVWKYEVQAVDVLGPADIDAMTDGEYDLTLFTCTYGGQSRVTVRCDGV